MYKAIEINNEDIGNLMKIFKDYDMQDVSARINKGMISTKVYIDSYEESSLYFYIFKDEVVIQSVSITNKRRGIGTKLIKECANIGRSKNVSKIRIQSVISNEMVSLCKKFRFKQDEYTSFFEDKGDYIGLIDDVLSF